MKSKLVRPITKRNREADQKRWEANNRKWMIHRNRAAAWKAELK